ncbi:hypothetical protein LPB136_12815 [Tenacibaculum todarodis]|uniref:AlgX/AlgJ SGNH hydrolase-like domain-containing protein n=1 Tax=Tenacibaculum todarodis TaxID=1850252 RepID=A0A1L3JM23_9FLAO|nr:hypothetical protein [Tenacibaculum todarodis]APG66200.1 hypothetical protein LPB136_12815 [Tenacibaculum todarodis]
MKKTVFILSLIFFNILQTRSQNLLEVESKRILTDNKTKKTIKGLDGWMFLRDEINHLSKGKFYGEVSKITSENKQNGRQDPIPAIVDFNNQLQKLGVTLFVMPVPPKALLYPDKLSKKLSIKNTYDVNYKELFSKLEKSGVKTINLISKFKNNRRKGIETYCKQDSHWSPNGINTASEEILKKVSENSWYIDYLKENKLSESPNKLEIEIEGDLWKNSNKSDKKEKIKIKQYNKLSQLNNNSPVLLMGDSHCLIFHSSNDMLAENAGLPGVLASKLGFNLDLIAVKGSGTNSVRIDLYRKAKKIDWIKNKKVVIWCFTGRDFSESISGWRKIPVVKN